MGQKQEAQALKAEASVEREREEEERRPHVFASLLRKTNFNKTDVKLSKGTFFFCSMPLSSSSGDWGGSLYEALTPCLVVLQHNRGATWVVLATPMAGVSFLPDEVT